MAVIWGLDIAHLDGFGLSMGIRLTALGFDLSGSW